MDEISLTTGNPVSNILRISVQQCELACHSVYQFFNNNVIIVETYLQIQAQSIKSNLNQFFNNNVIIVETCLQIRAQSI